MEKKIDIAAIGEMLIDFTQLNNTEGRITFEQNPGGAPANVLAAAGKLKKKTAIISKVGNDVFGRFLKSVAEKENIDTSALILSDEYPTTLAFVTLDENGDRSFEFMRKSSADVMLNADEVDDRILSSCKVFHFGSVSMTDEPSRSATLESVKKAKKAGAVISYDPNYRQMLWASYEEALKVIPSCLEYVDVLKVADNEVSLFTEEKDIKSAAKKLLEKGPSFVFVTLGADGCYFASKLYGSGYAKGYKVDTVDTTGAGDAFTGAALSKLIDCGFAPGKDGLSEIADFSNAAGALNTTKRGAIPAMASAEEIAEIRLRACR